MHLPTYRFNQKTIASQLQNGFWSFLWFLGRRAFMVILLVILLEIILGSFLCYWYVVLPQPSSENEADTVIFSNSTYTHVLQEWEQRKQFTGPEVYSNPF